MRTILLSAALLAGCASDTPQAPWRHAEVAEPPIHEFGPMCTQMAKLVRIGIGDRAFPKAAVTAGYVDGWVVLRHDIVNGKTLNATVVASSPPVFEAIALRTVASMEYAETASIDQCVTFFRYRLEQN